MYRYILLFACVILQLVSQQAAAHRGGKREFRGAWIQCVNGQWIGLGRDKMQRELTNQLDELQSCGINAIMFQVRAEGDALYKSQLEPWSRYLTGLQGLPPNPMWDPLEWMVSECHSRGMECHAWINPYRAKTAGTSSLASNHQAVLHPERCFDYAGLKIFDPGIAENADFIIEVAKDIVSRYDVDGLHIDDYFYPYPKAGQPIPDEATYQRCGLGITREDWRRENVNNFVRRLSEAIKSVKPWCKFGVSPFGIYHNEKNGADIPGSRTNGLQNYDDLYADILLWVEKGWVDYNIPQIYWEIGNKAADYQELVNWWSRYAGKRHLYIGQDVHRTVKHPDPQDPSIHQMQAKYNMQRALPHIEGSCQWYAKAVCDNPGNYATMLKQTYHRYPALQPTMPWIDKRAPKRPRKLAIVPTSDGPGLFWTAPKAKHDMDQATKYVIYRFDKRQKVNLDDPSHIVTITDKTHYILPDDALGHLYVVTALDRMHNESKPVKMKL